MSERDRRSSTPTLFSAIAERMMEELPPPPELPPDESAKREADMRAARQRTWMNAALEVARVRAVRWLFENPDSDSLALSAVRNWIEAPRAPHLLLRGTTGTGKTVAAAHLVRYCTEPNARTPGVTWLYPDDVPSAVLQSWSETAPKLARFVVIDELGTETRPDFMTALSRLLDRDSCSVLMTTNLSQEKFGERYGKDERLTSRASGAVEIVDVPGKDRRVPINNG